MTGTTPSPRWERRKEDRPGDLLATALIEFTERGYAATRLEDVAARAGVSKGTLYLYYPGKEALFQAVIRESIVPLLADYESTVAGSDAPSAELLERFFQDWWRYFGSTQLAGLCKLIVAESGNFPDVARFFQQEVVEPEGRLLGDIIERGIARGEFRQVDVECLVEISLSPMVMRAIWQHSIEPVCPLGRIELDRFLACHLDQLLAYLGQPGRYCPRGPAGTPELLE